MMACQRDLLSQGWLGRLGGFFFSTGGMTMSRFVWALLTAGACVLAGGGLVSAGDVIRLGGTSAADAVGDTDTSLVRWGGRGFGGFGGYRGFGYGGYRGFG